MMVPLGELEKQGAAQVTWGGGRHDVRKFDIMVGQRVCNEGAHQEWLRLAAHKGRNYRLVFEIDDDLWHCEEANAPAWAFYAKDPARLRRLRECAMTADLVTTTTETLARRLAKITDAPIAVLPNCVSGMIFKTERKPCEAYTLGFGGSLSHAGDWADQGGGIGRYLQRNQDVRMHFIGAQFAGALPGSVHGQVYATEWVANVEEYHKRLIMDVGLAPLRDTYFNRAKSALKALEYQALGIVPVVSDMPVYRGQVKDGVTGFLCGDDRQWARALAALRDPATRARMAEAGRQKASGQKIARHAPAWARAYVEALRAPARALALQAGRARTGRHRTAGNAKSRPPAAFCRGPAGIPAGGDSAGRPA